MKRKWFYLIITALLGGLLFSCGRAADEDSKGFVDEVTEQAAEEAVKTMHSPLDRARSVQDAGRERMQQMEESAEY